MTERIAPKIDPDRLDFSMWHPLDHRPLSKRCREHYGGFRNHMKLVWEYKWDVTSKIKRITHCSRGKHCPGTWWRRDGIVGGKMVYGGQDCSWCFKKLSE